MAIEARDRTLPDWFTRIRLHQTVLPRFQRFEAWDNKNIMQLFNTVLQELPVGALLVLEIGNDEPFISRALEGAPTTGERVTEHLLDGQQRLTALWRGLHNNYPDRTYFVNLYPDEETGAPFFVSAQARWKKEGDTEMRPFWANDPKRLWAKRMIPLDLCAPDLDSQTRFKEWRNSAIQNPEERESATEEVTAIRQLFALFNLPFLSLPANTKPEVALDVFLKMNTSAAPLSSYDIVVAQVEASVGTSIHDLVSIIKQACPNAQHYYAPEELVLYASALLQQKAPTNANYLSKEFGTGLLANLSLLQKGIKRAVTFLEEERVFDAARLPSDVVVPVLAALWAHIPEGLDAEGRARIILRKYLWRSFFSDRYEKSTNSRSLVDYQQVRALIDSNSADLPVALDDEKHPLPSIESLQTAGWPTKKDRLARAILAVALRHGGRDLADDSSVSRENLAHREYHHLFPHAYLEKLKVEDSKIFLSLNCALVTWKTNRNISDKNPEKYLAERLDAKSGVTEEDVRARLESHLIPYAEMVASNYPKFLKKRAEEIHAEMLKLCGAAPAMPQVTNASVGSK